jgi:hypothetical protein
MERVKAYLDPGEIEVLGNTATNLCDRLLIIMSFRLGYRVSEFLGLREG